MVRRVIISHGTLGHPGRAWIPWLSSELQRQGLEVLTPCYPTPENQSLDSWIATFHAAAGALRQSDILVGHSLGSVLTLRLLERSVVSIQAAFLVAVFSEPIGNLRFDALNSSFIEPVFDWRKIRSSANVFMCYNSNNDPFIPLSMGLRVASSLRIEPVIVDNGGHLNASSGYSQFPPFMLT